MKRLTISILTGLLLITLALAYVGIQSQQAHAQQPSRSTLWRFLDTNGDGTGTKNANGDYSTPDIFYLQPPDGSVYNITRLIVTIEDSLVVSSTTYGAISALTNGVAVRRVSGSATVTYTEELSITTNLAWGRFCELSQTNVSGTGNQLRAVCEFEGLRLNGDRDEKLEVYLSDNFTGLDGHYFEAQGYRE
jgi:hypothetical protein